MGRASPALTAFCAGEFSPQMEGRTDEDKYAIAAHIIQNFIPLKQGPATFRQGTAYVQPVKNSVNRTWLVRFEFSQTQAFMLEFGDLYLRFYTNHGPLLATGIAAYDNRIYFIGDLALSGGIIYYCIAGNGGGGFSPPANPTFWYPMTPYNGCLLYTSPSPRD